VKILTAKLWLRRLAWTRRPRASLRCLLTTGATDEWILTEAGPLGAARHLANAVAFRGSQVHARGIPRFSTSSERNLAPTLRSAVLIPGDLRRARYPISTPSEGAFARWRYHDELLRMLTTPRNRVLDTHENVIRDAAFEEPMNPSKGHSKRSLASCRCSWCRGRQAWGKPANPSFAIWSAAVSGRTTPDGCLLTAQSNAAVDHLMDELHSGFGGTTNPELLVVRCRPLTTRMRPALSRWARRREKILKKLLSSRLLDSAAPTLKAELRSGWRTS